MEGFPDSAWIFAGSVIAALIVLFSGWLQQKISRASTVSGYRQKWIQDIRNAFSDYLNELEKLSDSASANSEADHSFGAHSTVLEDTRPVRKSRNFLRLYTNPEEREHLGILEEAESIETYLTGTPRRDLELTEFERRRNALTRMFQDALKEEWDRVKLGELRWRVRRCWRRITNHSSRRSQARAA
tara:strand:- start:3300 stop:3857 length:558 start_codon:yes stop_codon:yes gene_type:complete